MVFKFIKREARKKVQFDSEKMVEVETLGQERKKRKCYYETDLEKELGLNSHSDIETEISSKELMSHAFKDVRKEPSTIKQLYIALRKVQYVEKHLVVFKRFHLCLIPDIYHAVCFSYEALRVTLKDIILPSIILQEETVRTTNWSALYNQVKLLNIKSRLSSIFEQISILQSSFKLERSHYSNLFCEFVDVYTLSMILTTRDFDSHMEKIYSDLSHIDAYSVQVDRQRQTHLLFQTLILLAKDYGLLESMVTKKCMGVSKYPFYDLEKSNKLVMAALSYLETNYDQVDTFLHRIVNSETTSEDSYSEVSSFMGNSESESESENESDEDCLQDITTGGNTLVPTSKDLHKMSENGTNASRNAIAYVHDVYTTATKYANSADFFDCTLDMGRKVIRCSDCYDYLIALIFALSLRLVFLATRLYKCCTPATKLAIQILLFCLYYILLLNYKGYIQF